MKHFLMIVLVLAGLITFAGCGKSVTGTPTPLQLTKPIVD